MRRAPGRQSLAAAAGRLVQGNLGHALERLLSGATRAGLATPERESGQDSPPVPRLVPGAVSRKGDKGPIVVRRLGRFEHSPWGTRRTLRGVEAIRGFCLSPVPVREVVVRLGGRVIGRVEPQGGTPATGGRLRKYVFNLWHDLGDWPPGLYRLQIHMRVAGLLGLTRTIRVVVAAPLDEADHPGLDGLIPPRPGDARPLDEQINSAPSLVRPARRQLLPGPVRSVLVLRTDQLGDMVVSIPALRRLRELFPDAKLVGLLTSANAAFARTLGLFDEVLEAEFPDDPGERRRVMPAEVQRALRDRLQTERFDVALDLAQSSVSREVLLLSGARFTYGVDDRSFPWLSAGFDLNTHDARNGLDVAAHSTKVLGMVEALGALLADTAVTIRRPELGRDLLAPFGLADGTGYAVLHTGARIAFSRWPHYPALARLLLEHTPLSVVLMAEGEAARAGLPEDLLASPRVRLIDGRLSFDTFDALLSRASVFVGNDSGPKHLASLRGTPVVSLHSARINWSEWGQDNTGLIVSRKVPCAGCAIFHDVEECGRDFVCITAIRPEEVLGAVMRVL